MNSYQIFPFESNAFKLPHVSNSLLKVTVNFWKFVIFLRFNLLITAIFLGSKLFINKVILIVLTFNIWVDIVIFVMLIIVISFGPHDDLGSFCRPILVLSNPTDPIHTVSMSEHGWLHNWLFKFWTGCNTSSSNFVLLNLVLRNGNASHLVFKRLC